jgi:branched-chain amino acid transport system ATP-binding protein
VKLLGVDMGPMRPKKPRGLRKYFNDVTRGEALYPLLVLFGLLAVEQLDQNAFAVLAPDIQKSFGLSLAGLGALVALTSIGSLLIEVPLAFQSDRLNRSRLALIGAAIWGVFGFGTGLAFTLWFLIIARSGANAGRAVVTPTHNSLIADFYPVDARTDAYGFHRMAVPVGAFIGAALGGVIGQYWGWRWAFIVFAIPTLCVVLFGLKLREPQRGKWERTAMGASEETIATDEVPPSFAESVRILWAIGTLRRIWYSLPFLATAFLGVAVLLSVYYQDAFGLDDAARGWINAATQPAAFIGLMLGIPLASRLMLQDPGLGLKLLAVVGVLLAGAFVVVVITPYLWLAIVMNMIVAMLAALLTPGIFAALSLAIPPKVRSMGYAMASLFILPGLFGIYIVTWMADNWGVREGLLMMGPIFLIGSWVLASGSMYIKSDINRVWTSTAAQAEVAYQRKAGLAKLLLVRNIDVQYDNVQVLFGVNFEVDEGELVALLGTNGAGKSTLLKTICGLVQATNGAVVFDGRDATYAPPDEVAARGVVLMPGGQGTFPGLTVAENLDLAGWTQRRDKAHVAAARARVLEIFPVLAERWDEPAGNLSGGQQQMLALSMAFVMKPRLLMIDELSLGLAPVVVEQLLGIVREISAQGTTIILVEQSVNLALQLAETAYFMEKGEIRFHGPTHELLERPDILRSVFLEGAASVQGNEALTESLTESVLEEVETTNGLVEHDIDVESAVPATVAEENGAPVVARRRVLRVEDVTKVFGGVRALNSVSFDVDDGEIVGLIGPNGAGKTTLFDAIGGFIQLDYGSVILGSDDDEIDLTAMPAYTRSWLGLGRSFQDGRLFPNLTVAETMAISLERSVEVRDPVAAALHLPAVADSEKKVAARVEELLELTGTQDFRHKLVRELSTGSKRIVDLACMLAHGPSVLLLDEPSSGIAQRESEALAPVLLRIREQTGASLLVIEHDVPLLLSVADRLVAMDLGEVVADGEPSDVVNDDRVIASYLGTGTAVARSGAGAT